MKIKVNFKIGNNTYQIECEERDEKETLHKVIVLSNPLLTCNVCNVSGIQTKHLTSNKDQEGNIYINIKCNCGARSKLGYYKTGGFFWHDYEKYVQKKDNI